MPKPHPKLQFVFQKERHIETHNFAPVTQVLDGPAMPAPALRDYCDRVQFEFQGYEQETSPAFVIPEIRRFLRTFRAAWPYGPFFCDLRKSYLLHEAAAHLDHLVLFEDDRAEACSLTIRIDELRDYVNQAHRIIEMLGQRVQMNRSAIRTRQARFDRYIAARFGPFRK